MDTTPTNSSAGMGVSYIQYLKLLSAIALHVATQSLKQEGVPAHVVLKQANSMWQRIHTREDRRIMGISER